VSVERAGSSLSRLGRYEVGAKIADGGMATVHVARRALDHQVVAIKRIREDYARTKEFREMFLDEAKIFARLRHPSIVRYFELDSDGVQAFIAMELLRGQSLWALWDTCRGRGIRLRYETIAWIGARVAEGLHYAHELVDERGAPLDIVHRDVNATNIFVTFEGGIKVIDFGLAKAANRASKTAAGIIKGKVAYMSPEQAVGAPIDRRTDVFALGTTLWELACDRRLFKHVDEVETLKRVHAAEVPDPGAMVTGFPPALGRVLMRALARDKERRYATGAEFARDLDAFVRGRAGAEELSALMHDLFAAERNRQAAWTATWDSERLDSPASCPGEVRDTMSNSTELAVIEVTVSGVVSSSSGLPVTIRPPRRLAGVAALVALAVLCTVALALALR
jgi:eukaryotic-like serine/threonine-protein kinase